MTRPLFGGGGRRSVMGRPARTPLDAKRGATKDEKQQRNAERFGTQLRGSQRRRGWW